MAAEVAEAKAVLDQVVIVDLPELEEAIREGDYDLAFARAAIVRDIRNRVRSLLAGADGSGELRVQWAKVEPRLDAALIAAPRPNADPTSGRQAWQTQRTARGTDAHTRRPRLSSAAGLGNRRAQRPSAPAPVVTAPGRRAQRPSAGAPMRAVAAAVAAEVYYAPEPPPPREEPDDERTIKRRTLPRFGGGDR
jgi:hypothetical protein